MKWIALLASVFMVLAAFTAVVRFAAGDVAAGALQSVVTVSALVAAVCSWRIGRLFDDG